MGSEGGSADYLANGGLWSPFASPRTLVPFCEKLAKLIAAHPLIIHEHTNGMNAVRCGASQGGGVRPVLRNERFSRVAKGVDRSRPPAGE